MPKQNIIDLTFKIGALIIVPIALIFMLVGACFMLLGSGLISLVTP